LVYYRHFDASDFRLNVGVVNDAPAKWELQFLFNIIPCYIYRVKETTWPLITELYIEPKSPGITFELGRVFFLQSNRAPLPPSWSEGSFPVTDTFNSFPVTNSITLRLAFKGTNRGSIDQDIPFQLSIEGIRVSGETYRLPQIDFRPATAVRPGFRLPY
jgi:hypothetical protein